MHLPWVWVSERAAVPQDRSSSVVSLLAFSVSYAAARLVIRTSCSLLDRDLGIGFSLGVLSQGLFLIAVWIGLTASTMTWLAMKLGNRLSARFAKRMEIIGGLILIMIAFKLLVA